MIRRRRRSVVEGKTASPWQDATVGATLRAGDLIFALGRLAPLSDENHADVRSATMFYFVGGSAAMVWAGNEARIGLARVEVQNAETANPWFACLPSGFLAALRSNFERGDSIDLARSAAGELLVRRAGARSGVTLVQPLWDPQVHIELYNAVATAGDTATAALVHGAGVREALGASGVPEVVTVDIGAGVLSLSSGRGSGHGWSRSIPATLVGDPAAASVPANELLAAVRAVVDVKHPGLQVEVVGAGSALRLRGVRTVPSTAPGQIDVVLFTSSRGASASRVAQPPVPAESRILDLPASNPIEEILAELDAIIGQDAVKDQVRRLQSQVVTNRRRQELGLGAAQLTSHMVFTGPPGTGKTTVARLIAKLYHALGVLENDAVVEVSRPDLVSSNIGGTDEKTSAVIQRAQGGVLFIDEAYDLAEGGEQDFGTQAIDVLLKALEDKRDSFVCIIAGYADRMAGFLDVNPGLRSRFRRRIPFEPYSPDELVRIAEGMARAGDNVLTEEAEAELRRRLHDERRRGGFETPTWGNARSVRNVIETAVEYRDDRISASGAHDRESLITLHAQDIARACDDDKIGSTSSGVETVEDVLAELDAQVGQPQLKRQVRAILADARVARAKLDRGADQSGVSIEHLLFQGPPGTGKTTVARLVARLYRALGILPRESIVEVNRESLVAGYVGQTAIQTTKKIDEAMGGVLFIDEAYALVSGGGPNDFGKEAIETLLPRLENDNGKFLAIAAGYPEHMTAFLSANVGLRSRFTTTIEFVPYTADELVLIAESMARGRGERLTDDARSALRERLQRAEEAGAFAEKDWGNARSVRTLIGRAVQQRNLRIDLDGADDDALSLLEEEDIVGACDIEGIGRTGRGQESAADVLAELDAQIGQEELKRQVRTIVAQAEIAMARRAKGSDHAVPLDHLVFSGPPGTGKTTIARLIGRLYRALGLLPTGEMVEVDRPALVGAHIGATEARTTAKIDEAMGGILFIDEAYALVREGANDFGQEAIDTLLPRLDNDRGKFLTIVAGYPDQMSAFLRANPGLLSRFPTEITFQSYSSSELVLIGEKMAQAGGQHLEEAAVECLRARLEAAERRGVFSSKEWGNGRSVRNIIDAARRERDLRLHESGYSDDAELGLITAADVEAACDRNAV